MALNEPRTPERGEPSRQASSPLSAEKRKGRGRASSRVSFEDPLPDRTSPHTPAAATLVDPFNPRKTPEQGSSSKQQSSPFTGELSPLKVIGTHETVCKARQAYNVMEFEDPIADIRKWLPSLVGVQEALKEEQNRRKRDLSDSSVGSICERYSNFTEKKKGNPDIKLENFNKEYKQMVQRRVETRIRLTELHLAQRNEDFRRLTEDQKKLEHHQFASARDGIEWQVHNIASNLIALKRQRHSIVGRLLDFRHEFQLNKEVDLAVDNLMDSMIATWQIESAGRTLHAGDALTGKRRSSEQSSWRRRLISYYDAEPESEKDYPESERAFWCPITKQYHCFGMKAVDIVQIVPHAIGEVNCIHLFGSEEVGTGHLMSTKNGILLHPHLEAALDKAQIAIVPADEENPSAEELKVVVFDESILKLTRVGLNFDWKSLNGLRLQFRNGNRPDLRYLYFSYLVTLCRRRRFEGSGWQSDLKKYAVRTMWGSSGKWVRESSLRAIARRVAYEPDLEDFLGTPDLPLVRAQTFQDFDDSLLAEEVITAYEKRKFEKGEQSLGEQVEQAEQAEED